MEKLSYESYVEKGKDLVEQIECFQCKLAEYATAACTIRHGGRSEGFYTLKDYATDIGMQYKTLQQYVQIYRTVVVKLEEPVTTIGQWSNARKTNDLIGLQTTIANKTLGTKNKRRNIDTPAENVREIYNTMDSEEKPFILELHRAIRSSKHTKHIIDKRDLSIAGDDQLLHLMQVLDSTSDLINNYLTEKKKGMGRVG